MKPESIMSSAFSSRLYWVGWLYYIFPDGFGLSDSHAASSFRISSIEIFEFSKSSGVSLSYDGESLL